MITMRDKITKAIVAEVDRQDKENKLCIFRLDEDGIEFDYGEYIDLRKVVDAIVTAISEPSK